MLLICYGKKEINTLKAENQQLQNIIVQLKETDQGFFSSSVDKLNLAKSKQEWQEVANAFRVFGQKFPNSQYISQAQNYLAQATQKFNEMQRIDDGIDTINKAVQNRHWKTARQTLQNIKKDISSDQYEKLKNYIYEESHKPIQTTVNEIASDPSIFIGKRVKVTVSLSSSVDRSRKALHAYNNPMHEGSSIDILYGKTSPQTIKYFVENEPKWMSGETYTLVGVVKEGGLPLGALQNSWGETVYIQAEKFE